MPSSLLEPIRPNRVATSTLPSKRTASPRLQSPSPSLTLGSRLISPSSNRIPSSARSDRSDGSAYSSEGGGSTASKKVSFNKAVRVKKYSQPTPTQSSDLSETKFWFKVHKANQSDNQNHHQQSTINDVKSSNNSNNNHHHHQQSLSTNNSNNHNSSIESTSPSLSVSASPSPTDLVDSAVDCSSPIDRVSPSEKSGTRPLSTIIESDTSPRSTPTPKSTMPINQKNSVVIDYSSDNNGLNRTQVTSNPYSSTMFDSSKPRRIISYEPFKSKSSIELDVDSSLRPRSPSPLYRNGRTTSADGYNRVSPSSENHKMSSSLYSPGEATEEIIETKKIEKKNPLLSGVKVMFGVKAKKAPTFPTMPSRTKTKEIGTKSSMETINRPSKETKEMKLSSPSSRLSPTSKSEVKSRDPSPYIGSRGSPSTRESPTILTSTLKKSYKSSSPEREASRPSSTMTANKKASNGIVNSTNTMEVERRSIDSREELLPVATWESGPLLVSDQVNRESASTYVPGEGKIMSTFEEGSKVWKNKTRRVYEEPIKIPRDKSASPERPREQLKDRSLSPDRSSYQRRSSPDRSPERVKSRSKVWKASPDDRNRSPERPRDYDRNRSPSPANVSPDRTKVRSRSPDHSRRDRSPQRNGHNTSNDRQTYNNKLLTGEDLDEVFLRREAHTNENEPDDLVIEYMPKMEDKACQCNLKKSSRARTESGLSYRVIKPANDGSVSTFSNVPALSDEETNSRRPRSVSPIRTSRKSSPIRRDPMTTSEVIYSQVDKSKKRSNLNTSSSPTRTIVYRTGQDPVDVPVDFDDYVYEANAVRSPTQNVETPPTHRYTQSTYTHRQSPSPSPVRYAEGTLQTRSLSPEMAKSNKTVTSKTKSYGFNMRTALDAPEVSLPTRSPSRSKPVRNIEPSSDWYVGNGGTIPRSSRIRSAERAEQRHETYSVASSDELIATQNGLHSDIDDRIAPKSIIREIDHRKGEISYENVLPRRSVAAKEAYDGQVADGSGFWFKSLDEDYRKGMSERDGVSYHSALSPDTKVRSGGVSDYCTMGRRGRDAGLPEINGRSKRDYSPASTGHAYTLDRRHLDRKRNKRSGYLSSGGMSHLGISSPVTSSRRDYEVGSECAMPMSMRSTTMTNPMRKYNSNRDLTLQSDFGDIGPTRGGLAAAYKARQRRASSLSRYGQTGDLYSPLGYSPLPTGSHSQLHRLHLNGYPHHPSHHHHSTHSSSESEAGGIRSGSRYGSRTQLHQNDPVVLYIPAISHHNRRADEDDRSSGLGIARTQSILSTSKQSTKSGSLLGSKSKRNPSKERDANFNEITAKVNGYVNKTRPSGLHEDDEIVELRDDDDSKSKTGNGNKNLKRSVSIPKDTKLPWLQKLKMKVKS